MIRKIKYLKSVTYTPAGIADRRGFFSIDINGKEYLIFSKEMALESLTQLIHVLPFRQLAVEWKTKEIEKGLSTVSNKSGAWFEQLVSKQLLKKDIKNVVSVKKLFTSEKIIHVPQTVGDIDLIGFNPKGNILYIFECKFVKFSSESKIDRDDISNFITSSKSYDFKFKKKIAWLTENISLIIEHMNYNKISISEVDNIEPILITFYPTIVRGFITDYKCTNFVEYFSTSH